MAAPGPSAIVARAGLHLVFTPGTPPLGDETPLTLAFARFFALKRQDVNADAWLTVVAQHAEDGNWVRLRIFPDMHTLGIFPENAERITCRGRAVVLRDDGTDGEIFSCNLEMSIADRRPREILGTLTLFGMGQ